MIRVRVSSFPADVSQFSGIQLQPRALLGFGLNASGGWLLEHAISHRELLRRHRVGFVFWAVDLAYEAPLRYLEAETLEVRTEARVRKSGAQLEFAVGVHAMDKRVAEVKTCSVPLWIAEEDELSGLPAPMTQELIDRFEPEERDDTPYESAVPALLSALARDAKLLARREERLFFHRQHCEFADQWYFGVTADFAGVGRERLALTEGDDVPLLRKGLSHPIRKLHMLFEKPFALFDTGTLETTAHERPEGVVFVHRLYGERRELHATAVELF